MGRAFEIIPLTPTIGAEIRGLDLDAPLTPAAEDALYSALLDHLVLFFRDQEIAPARHLALAQSLGRLDSPHPLYAHVPGFEEIVLLANSAENPPDTDGWHSDLTFKPDPPFASLLVAREVPAVGGDTLWANMYAAYEALPPAMKSELEALTAVHDMGDFRNDFTRNAVSGDALTDAMQRFGCALHKVVQSHPATGRKFLYVNESFTTHLVGLKARDSRRLLNYLFDHIDSPDFHVRFRWQEGSMAIWDNRCTQHYALADYLPARRQMHRVTVVHDRRLAGLK